VNISYRPEERDFGPARMPDKDYVVLTRDAAAHEHGVTAFLRPPYESMKSWKWRRIICARPQYPASRSNAS